jgi:hypothetical protein
MQVWSKEERSAAGVGQPGVHGCWIQPAAVEKKPWIMCKFKIMGTLIMHIQHGGAVHPTSQLSRLTGHADAALAHRKRA